MRGRPLRALLLCCTLCLLTSARVRAQAAPPPEPQAPPTSDVSAPEHAEPPPTAAPATPDAAPPSEPSPGVQPSSRPGQAPPPPPPAHAGDYGGRASPQPSAAEPPSRADDQGAAETDDYGGSPQKREYSIRLDPFNWLLQGRLGFELEVTAWKFISVELVPILVTNTQPPAVNYMGFDSALTQHSNGIGPFSGASLGAGFWLSGEPFSGYVLRVYLTNYGYTYQARDAAGVFDKLSFTERRAVAFFGSHSRFGPFTLAGGFGLGYELNQQERCGLAVVSGTGEIAGRHSDCGGKQEIALSRSLGESANLNSSILPALYLEARFSLGFVF